MKPLTNKPETLELLPNQKGFSMFRKPFYQNIKLDPQILENPGLADNKISVVKPVPSVMDENVIEERNGLHYINKSFLESDNSGLDQDFKKLVDDLV